MPNVVYGRSQANVNWGGRVITLDTTPAKITTVSRITSFPILDTLKRVDLIGAITFNMTLIKFIKVTRTGGLTFTGVIKKKALRKLIASLSFVGVVKKKTLRKLLGGVSFTGTVKKLTKAKRTGTLSFIGLPKRLNKLKRTGSLNFSGGMKLKTLRLITAVLNLTGVVKRKSFRALTSSLSFTGGIKKLVRLKFTSSLSFLGTLTKEIIIRQLGVLTLGSLNFTGSLKRKIFKTLEGSLRLLGRLTALAPKLALLFLNLKSLRPRLSISIKPTSRLGLSIKMFIKSLHISTVARLGIGIKVSNRLSIKCSPMQLEIRSDTDITVNVMDLLISAPVTDAVVAIQLYTGRNDIDPLRLPGEPATDVIICAKINESGDYLGTIPRGALIDISQSYTIVVDVVSGVYTAHREFQMPLVTGGE